MKYVLMFVGSSDDQDAWEKLSKDQRAVAYEAAGKWFEEHSKAGRLVGGAELQGPNTATTVRIKNGKAMVPHGPYIETKADGRGVPIGGIQDLGRVPALD